MGNAEARRQAEIVAWIRANVPDVIVYAVLNDGLFTKQEAAKRKWLGLLPGVPDVAIVHPGGAAFLEIKDLGCEPSAVQSEMMQTLESLGARCAVARSIDDARQFFTLLGLYTEQSQEVA